MIKLRKILIISVLPLLWMLFGCTNSSQDSASQNTLENSISDHKLDEILKRGKLVAITNNTPTNYFIYKGKPMGYQYELLRDFTKYLGVKLEIKMVNNISDAIDSLKNHKADILAMGLTIVSDRKKNIDFTLPITQTYQILIQRIPEDQLNSRPSSIEKHLIRDVTDLAHKTVYVEEGSSYVTRLKNLQNEIGEPINIRTYSGNITVDSIMSLVSSGEIDYAVSEDYTAKFFLKYHPNLDIKTPVSLTQNLAWAVPKNSTTLLDTCNSWIEKNKNSRRWAVLYDKYFKYTSSMNKKTNSEYTMSNGTISPYDDLIKKYAGKIGWNWMLLAAQISVESGFKKDNTSWTGAEGLMQILPSTAAHLSKDSTNLNLPEKNIAIGTKYNKLLQEYWEEAGADSLEAIKFALASYNIGRGHVYDAQRLAEKYNLDPLIWENNVALMMKNLSKPEYYRDPVVRNGYCRGIEAYTYVDKIFHLYQNYRNFDPEKN
jgi:membrane-bound lytic murein transglycosylase F